MAELVAKTGLVKEPGFLYFLKHNEIWRQPMKKAPGTTANTGPELVWKGDFELDPGYLYFIGPTGDIHRAQRNVPRPTLPPPEAVPNGPAAPRAEVIELPLSESTFARVSERVPPLLRSFLRLSPSGLKLELRGRWSRLGNEDLRSLAAHVIEGEARHLFLAKEPGEASIRFDTPRDSSFELASPIERADVVAKLSAVAAPLDETMIQFFEAFGESDGFVLPSAQETFGTEFRSTVGEWPNGELRQAAPVLFRPGNGDCIVLECKSGACLWANHERQRFEPAGSSFGELLHRYVKITLRGGVFDAFSAARDP